jgi:hypothetical protein
MVFPPSSPFFSESNNLETYIQIELLHKVN